MKQKKSIPHVGDAVSFVAAAGDFAVHSGVKEDGLTGSFEMSN